MDPEETKISESIALKFFVNTPYWRGVPFIIEAGKSLKRKSSEIQLIFNPQVSHEKSTLTFKIAPQEEVELCLYAKKPQESVAHLMHVNSGILSNKSSNAYCVIMKELMEGKRSVTVSFDEIKAQWNIVEKIQKRSFPLKLYPQQSEGPRWH